MIIHMNLWSISNKFHSAILVLSSTAFKLQANVGREKEFHASLQMLRGEDADVSEEAVEIKV